VPRSRAAHQVPVSPFSGSPCAGTPCCTHPSALGVAYFGGAALPPPASLRVLGARGTRGARVCSRPLAPRPLRLAAATSPGISAYGRGERGAERRYFNAPLWVGDLEKQLGEQECEVQPPPPRAWLPCRRAQGDLYKAMEEGSGGAGPPAPGLRLGTPSVGTPCPSVPLPWAADGMGGG